MVGTGLAENANGPDGRTPGPRLVQEMAEDPDCRALAIRARDGGEGVSVYFLFSAPPSNVDTIACM